MTEIDFDTLNRKLEENVAERGTWISMPFSFDYFFSTNRIRTSIITLTWIPAV